MTGDLNRVERACAELRRDRLQVTFTAVAAATGTARSTLYRNAAIRAVINEQRRRHATGGTLAGLTDEIATLRTVVDELAAAYAATRNSSADSPETDSVNRPTVRPRPKLAG